MLEMADRKIYCPGCDSEIRATASICPMCLRCPSCGARRIAGDPPCRCGHPGDLQQVEELVRKFGVERGGASRFRFSRGVLFALVMVGIGLGAILAARTYQREQEEEMRREGLEGAQGPSEQRQDLNRQAAR
jgi:hypothetical protein